MGKLIVVAGIKGGVGKTTTARNLSLALAANGVNTVAVDSDPQGSMRAFFAQRSIDTVDTVSCIHDPYAAGLKNRLIKLAEGYDRVVVDCGGRDTEALRRSCEAAGATGGTVVIPVMATQECMDAFAGMVAVVRSAREDYPDLKACVFVNMAPTHALDQSAEATATGLAENFADLDVMQTRLKQRSAWQASGFAASAIWDVPTKDSKASDEFNLLVAELATKGAI